MLNNLHLHVNSISAQQLWYQAFIFKNFLTRKSQFLEQSRSYTIQLSVNYYNFNNEMLNAKIL